MVLERFMIYAALRMDTPKSLGRNPKPRSARTEQEKCLMEQRETDECMVVTTSSLEWSYTTHSSLYDLSGIFHFLEYNRRKLCSIILPNVVHRSKH